MLRIDNIEISNFENAMRGMRNPKNSWDKNDTTEDLISLDCIDFSNINESSRILKINNDLCSFVTIGPNDLKLAQALIIAGSEHRKFLRQIFVSMDIDAPLYYWKEMDTYKIGTVANSCSTMHKITSKPISPNMFSLDNNYFLHGYDRYIVDEFFYLLEDLRIKSVEEDNKNAWRLLIQLLPSSLNQKRTWTTNYEVLRSIYHQREGHKLSEWETFRSYIESLPYAKELIIFKK